jgi:hypothetical protein
MRLIEDESGIAYSLAMICFFIVAASIILMYLAPVINRTTNTYQEDYVSQGIISEDTIDTLNFDLLLFKAIPFFTIFFGVFVYGIVRALYIKRSGGGD